MRPLERDEDKWTPVFRPSHATAKRPERKDVSLRHHPALVMVLLIGLAAGCSGFPELNRKVDPAVMAAPYPALLPFEDLQPPPAPKADPVAALVAEAAALKAAAAGQNADP